jgi:hypothetical protein
VDVIVRGTVLGIREKRGKEASKDTGEILEDVLKGHFVDLYDPASGAGELEADKDEKLPPVGARITASVSVRAYSGFVRRGAAGDAKVVFKLQGYRVDESAPVVANGKPAKVAASR